MSNIINVKVITNAKKEEMKEQDNSNYYKVWVRAIPEKGKANKAVIKIVADFFSVPKSHVRILRGYSSREKVLEIRTRQ